MKYMLPLILFLSGCTSISMAEVSDICPELTPMIILEPRGITTEEYLNNYFLISFDIGNSGRISNLKLLDSYSDDHMNEQALRAFGKWKFEPINKEGQAVEQKGCGYRYVQSEIEKLSESW